MTAEFNDPAIGSPTPLARELAIDFERAVLQLVVDGSDSNSPRLRDGSRGDLSDSAITRTTSLFAWLRA